MKKKEFEALIDRAIIEEEMAIPVLADHLKVAINWRGLSEEKKQKINEYLNIMIHDTKKHIQIFEKIKKMGRK